jgi:hypothetical protein
MRKPLSNYLPLLFTTVAFFCAPAQAFNPCKVLLCLAGQWRAIPDCVSDVTQFLYSFIRSPSLRCAQAGEGQLYSEDVLTHYMPCPQGMETAQPGKLYVQGSQIFSSGNQWAANEAVYAGIGSGENLQPDDRGYLPIKVCLRGYVGAITYTQTSTDNPINAEVWQDISNISPRVSGDAYDIFVNGKFSTRVFR